jgi:hypothetical protein
MKRSSPTALPLLLLLALTCAMPAHAERSVDRKKGQAKLKEAGPFDDDKVQLVELKADGVTLKAKLRTGEFFDKQTIYANADVTNTNDTAKHFEFYIAFFDAEGNMLGCTSQGSFGDEGLEADDKTQLGSCLIHLDPADIKKVATYQAVLYVSDKAVGEE